MSDITETATLTLAGARRVAEAAIAEAERRRVRIAVFVTGLAGDPLVLLRMDDVAPLAAETARRKCWSVAFTHRSTRDFGSMLKADLAVEPELFHGMLRIGDMVAIEGGVPVMSAGRQVGAVAVSGGSSDDDHDIASRAAQVISAAD